MFSMIYNVVNNAIQNTVEGQVILKSHNGNMGTGVSVADSGKGISPDQMKELFLRFRKKADPGSVNNGIGLAITKSIADFHRIEIKVESAPEKGTRFFFRFPENS
jgi:signal transduction histidine kinase